MRTSHPLALALSVLFAFFEPATAAAEGLAALTAEEFQGAVHFQQALEHPKVSKLKSRSAQIKEVAKDLRWKPKKLEEAIAKLEAIGDLETVKKRVETVVREAAEKTRVKGRVLDVLLNADEPKHVVLYVRWQASGAKDVVKEASTLAHVVATEAPLVSTLSLAAIHPKAQSSSKDAVWAAKISGPSMATIQKARIDEYGDRLYRGLFEGIEEKSF